MYIRDSGITGPPAPAKMGCPAPAKAWPEPGGWAGARKWQNFRRIFIYTNILHNHIIIYDVTYLKICLLGSDKVTTLAKLEEPFAFNIDLKR